MVECTVERRTEGGLRAEILYAAPGIPGRTDGGVHRGKDVILTVVSHYGLFSGFRGLLKDILIVGERGEIRRPGEPVRT